MRIALFSDIHGNLEALESIIEDIKQENIDQIICLGDVIGLGVNSKECLDLIIENNIELILGNHEIYFIKGIDIDNSIQGEEKLHHLWIHNTIKDEKYINYLNKCKLKKEIIREGLNLYFQHYLLKDNCELYPYIEKEEDIKLNDNEYMFIGHKHRPYNLNNIFCIGSSGCVKNNLTHYTILDIYNKDKINITTKEVKYDRIKFEEKIKNNEFPDKKLISQIFFGINK